jgi:hypothetical protein
MHPDPAVVALEAARLPAAGAMLARAFDADPFYCHALPDAAERHALLPDLLAAELRYCLLGGECHTLAGTEPRAAAGWLPAGHQHTPEQLASSGYLAVLERMDPAARDRLQAAVEYIRAVRLRVMPEPHW